MTTLSIRPYEDADHAAVRGLFIRVNRELAPEALRERFEDYTYLLDCKHVVSDAEMLGRGLWAVLDRQAGPRTAGKDAPQDGAWMIYLDDKLLGKAQATLNQGFETPILDLGF